MKIETKNVKFGDCNLIIGDYETLLVDCGSLNRDDSGKLSKEKFAYSQIEEYIKTEKIKNLMISHFDIDHFNGILEVPDTYKFENVYLPCAFFNNGSICATDIAIMLAIAPKSTRGFKLSKNIAELFIKLPEISRKIIFLKRGDKVDFDYKKINILWPDTDYPYFKSINFAQENYKVVFEKTENVEKIDLIENFVKSFNEYVNNISNVESTSQIDNEIKANFEQAFLQLTGSANSNRKKLFMETSHLKSFYYKRYHKLISCMNATSLICDCEERFVFLGDAPIPIIKFIESDFAKSYKIVKIQHHATSKYFTEATPTGEKYIISNGGYKNIKVDARFLNNKDIFVCTQKDVKDLNCQKYDLCKKCTKNCIDCISPNIC